MKVTIQPGCISCGTCERIAPEVFVVEVTAKVLLDCTQSECPCLKFKDRIKQAALECPVGVIVIDDGTKEK